MTERERLIELIGSKVCEDYSPNCDEWQPHSCEKCYANDCRIGELADYLLANNVKPLPFKIDDVVYGISRGQIIPIQIDTIQYTSEGINIYGSNEDYFGYRTIYLDVNNQIGIQWYKTKEEAEKALHKINHNSVCETETYIL